LSLVEFDADRAGADAAISVNGLIAYLTTGVLSEPNVRSAQKRSTNGTSKLSLVERFSLLWGRRRFVKLKGG
jgi:hypothetical protein